MWWNFCVLTYYVPLVAVTWFFFLWIKMNMSEFITCVLLLPYSFLHQYLHLSIMSFLLYILLSYFDSPLNSPVSLMNKSQCFLLICKHIYRQHTCMSANLLHRRLSSLSSNGHSACVSYSQDNSPQLQPISEYVIALHSLNSTGTNYWVTEARLLEYIDYLLLQQLHTLQ